MEHSNAEAEDSMPKLLLDWDFTAQAPRDEHDLLNTIMGCEVVMDGGKRSTVSKLLFRASYEQEALDTLERHGIRRLKTRGGSGEVYFFAHTIVSRMLDRTDFFGHKIDEYLLRIPGAFRSRQRLGGRELFHGVRVPVAVVDSVLGSDTADEVTPTVLEVV